MTEEQWQAICNNDAAYDGLFYYGVRTTGVVCRPSCTARQCLRQNVVVFDTLDDAVRAGYRMCMRCRPGDPTWRGAKAELADRAKAMVEAHATEKFLLEDLAGRLYVNKSYLLRVFKEVTGFTLLQYHNHVRCELAKDLIAAGELSMADVGHAVGFVSAAHFTRVFRATTGQTPTAYAKELKKRSESQ